MRALWLESGRLSVRGDAPLPVPGPAEALVRVRRAGICGTDLALVEGLYPFTGVPGHEFVGVVAEGPEALRGVRVVGEINVACGVCAECRRGRRKHCQAREALGIRGRGGAFAEYLCLPAANLHRVPETVSDEAATFTEPLAAALDILEQGAVAPSDRVVVVGTGRLGQLVCRALAPACGELVAVGRDESKLERLAGTGCWVAPAGGVPARAFDVAVECTGNPAGFAVALDALRPGGTLVVKSTYPGKLSVDAGRVVVDEIRILGSRCGPFGRALGLLATGAVDVAPLVDARYPLADAAKAFARSRDRGVIKVILEVGTH